MVVRDILTCSCLSPVKDSIPYDVQKSNILFRSKVISKKDDNLVLAKRMGKCKIQYKGFMSWGEKTGDFRCPHDWRPSKTYFAYQRILLSCFTPIDIYYMVLYHIIYSRISLDYFAILLLTLLQKVSVPDHSRWWSREQGLDFFLEQA